MIAVTGSPNQNKVLSADVPEHKPEGVIGCLSRGHQKPQAVREVSTNPAKRKGKVQRKMTMGQEEVVLDHDLLPRPPILRSRLKRDSYVSVILEPCL